MSKLFTLVWLHIKLLLGVSRIKSNMRSFKGILKNVGLLAILGLLGVVMWAYVYGLNKFIELTMAFNMHTVLISIIVFFAMLMVLIYGIFRNMGLYYGKDVEFLITLPIPQRTIYTAKFLTAYIEETAVFALIVLPPFILYGNAISADFFYWAKTAIICLLGALPAFAVASLLASGLMRISVFARYRDKIVTFGGFLLLIGFMILNQFISNYMAEMDSQAIVAFLSGNLISVIGRIFPPSIWATHSLIYIGSTGLNALLLFLGSCVVGAVLSIWLAGSAFARGASAQTEAVRSRKRVDVDKTSRSRSQLGALFIKEWKIMMRVPIYALNGLVQVIMVPVMIVMLFFLPTGSEGTEMTFLFDMVRAPEAAPYFILIAGAMVYLFAAFNTAGSTSFSREGQSAWLMQTMPVKAGTIATAKLLFSASIVLITCIVSAIGLGILFKLPTLSVITCTLVFVWSMPVVILGNMIDMLRPKLKWESETKAIKSNLNSFLAILLDFLYIIGGSYLTYKMGVWFNASMTTVIITITVISVVLGIAFFILTQRIAQPRIARMGED